jgi:outer membrane protein OmpA-like peptidoglycan-associated protein
MRTKTCLLTLLVLLACSLANAAYTSPGWSYGYELGIAMGDNAGSDENLAPLGRGHVELEILPMLYTRVGLGYTPLRAPGLYKTNLFTGDYRVTFRPLRHAKFSPFVYAGAGAALDLKTSVLDVMPLFPLGVGFQKSIKPGMMLEVTGGYNLVNSDNLDKRMRTDSDLNTFTGKKQDGFYSLTVGLSYFNPGPQPKPKPAPAPVVVAPPVVKPVVIPTPPPPPAPPVVKEVPPVAPDLRSLDSDKDGLSDYDEINVYKTNHLNADTDGDGLNDYVEVMQHKTDPLKADTDGDGLNDYAEVMQHKTNPLVADTDGDGLNDYAEVMQHKTNPLKTDTDGEGLNDYVEVMQYKTNPLVADTDGEGLNDYVEVMQYKTDPLKADTDGDGLSDFAEVTQYKTDPLDKDTDKGSIEDGAEVTAGTNPLDGKDDVMELKEGTKFSLEGIMFETGKAVIVPASTKILEQAYTALVANPDVKVLIIGHTDNVGSASSNMTLSQRRAEAVMNWLVAKGISKDRIRAEGRGLTEPRATNATPEGRQLNRRIDFEVVK